MTGQPQVAGAYVTAVPCCFMRINLKYTHNQNQTTQKPEYVSDSPPPNLSFHLFN